MFAIKNREIVRRIGRKKADYKLIRLRERDTLKLIGIGQKRRRHMTENRKTHAQEEDRRYTQVFEARCPVDASKVKHTVTFIAASCSRVDDLIEDFHCSRNSTCVQCQQNYL